MPIELEMRIAAITYATERLAYRRAHLELLGRIIGLATALVCLVTTAFGVAGAIVVLWLR